MKYIIYKDPKSDRFAHLALPSNFVDGDRLPALMTDRWFESHEAAIAALSELLERNEDESAAAAETAAPADDGGARSTEPPRRPLIWFRH
jgi:hypothetical protein